MASHAKLQFIILTAATLGEILLVMLGHNYLGFDLPRIVMP